MDASLIAFARQFVGVVAATLLVVLLTAFLAIPYALGAHPGAARPATALTWQHMT